MKQIMVASRGGKCGSSRSIKFAIVTDKGAKRLNECVGNRR
jgi:hypothetical protein